MKAIVESVELIEIELNDLPVIRNRELNAFQIAVRNYGFNAAIRFARNCGIDFIDCYVMAFGRMPTKI